MKILNKNLDKNGKGAITMIAEEEEDIWHVYNFMCRGDSLKTSTFRKVNQQSTTGSTTSNKVTLTLTIRVEDLDYDAEACMLRVKGKTITQNEHVKLGQYHTLELEVNRKFTLWKYCWDFIALERLAEVCEPTKRADTVGIVMQQGLAYICLITPSMTIVKSKIDVTIPRKRHNACSAHEKATFKFYDAIMSAILRIIDFSIVKCILIASPGFFRDHFFKYMMEKAVKENIKILLENKDKFTLVHSSSGFKSALQEVLADPLIAKKLIDTKAATEVKALEGFYEMLQKDSDRAYYGQNHVYKAQYKYRAIDQLLISDKLFRAKTAKKRQFYVKFVEDVKEAGGIVHIFSSQHVSGELLDNLGGIVAILKFAIPSLDEEESDFKPLDNTSDNELEEVTEEMLCLDL